MSIIVWILFSTLALKVIWNFGVPYALMRLPINPKNGEKGGVAPMLEIEIILLVLAVIFSWFSEGNSFVNKPIFIFGYGFAAMSASYLHFYIISVIVSCFTKMSK